MLPPGLRFAVSLSGSNLIQTIGGALTVNSNQQSVSRSFETSVTDKVTSPIPSSPICIDVSPQKNSPMIIDEPENQELESLPKRPSSPEDEEYLPVSFQSETDNEPVYESSERIPILGELSTIRHEEIEKNNSNVENNNSTNVSTAISSKSITTSSPLTSVNGSSLSPTSSNSEPLQTKSTESDSTSTCSTQRPISQIITLPKSELSNVKLSEKPLHISVNNKEIRITSENIRVEKTGVKLFLDPGMSIDSKDGDLEVLIINPIKDSKSTSSESTSSSNLKTPRLYLQSFRMLQGSYEIMMRMFSYLSPLQLLR